MGGRDFLKQLQLAAIVMKALDIELLHCCMIRDLTSQLWEKSIILFQPPPHVETKLFLLATNGNEITHVSVTITDHNSTRVYFLKLSHHGAWLNDFSTVGVFGHGGGEGPDAFHSPPPDHRSPCAAHHPGEEAGGGGARRSPASSAGAEESVQVQSCQDAAEVTVTPRSSWLLLLLFLLPLSLFIAPLSSHFQLMQ